MALQLRRNCCHRDALLLVLPGFFKCPNPSVAGFCSKIMAPGKSHTRTMVGTPYYFSPELVEVRGQQQMTGMGCCLSCKDSGWAESAAADPCVQASSATDLLAIDVCWASCN